MRIDSIGRPMPSQFTAGVDVAHAAKNAPGGWTTRAVGASELAKVSGEEPVEDEELRRDDPLGNLVSRAFGVDAASAFLRSLNV